MSQAHVELVYPSRLNLQGAIYEQGVRTPVDYDTAEALSGDDRFKVYGLNTREAVDHAARKARPSGAALRAAILAATEDLDVDKDENFDRAGKFSVAAISNALGYPITTEERDAALKKANAVATLEPADGSKAPAVQAKAGSGRIVRVSADKKEQLLKAAQTKDAASPEKPAAPQVEPAEQPAEPGPGVTM